MLLPVLLPMFLPMVLPKVLREHPVQWAEIATWTSRDAVEGDGGAGQRDVGERADAIGDLRRLHAGRRGAIRVHLEPRQQRLGIDDDVELVAARCERQRGMRDAEIVRAQRRRGWRREHRDRRDEDREPAPGILGRDGDSSHGAHDLVQGGVADTAPRQSDASSAWASGASMTSNVGCPSSARVTSTRALDRSPDAAAIAAA